MTKSKPTSDSSVAEGARAFREMHVEEKVLSIRQSEECSGANVRREGG